MQTKLKSMELNLIGNAEAVGIKTNNSNIKFCVTFKNPLSLFTKRRAFDLRLKNHNSLQNSKENIHQSGVSEPLTNSTLNVEVGEHFVTAPSSTNKRDQIQYLSKEIQTDIGNSFSANESLIDIEKNKDLSASKKNIHQLSLQALPSKEKGFNESLLDLIKPLKNIPGIKTRKRRSKKLFKRKTTIQKDDNKYLFKKSVHKTFKEENSKNSTNPEDNQKWSILKKGSNYQDKLKIITENYQKPPDVSAHPVDVVNYKLKKMILSENKKEHTSRRDKGKTKKVQFLLENFDKSVKENFPIKTRTSINEHIEHYQKMSTQYYNKDKNSLRVLPEIPGNYRKHLQKSKTINEPEKRLDKFKSKEFPELRNPKSILITKRDLRYKATTNLPLKGVAASKGEELKKILKSSSSYGDDSEPGLDLNFLLMR